MDSLGDSSRIPRRWDATSAREVIHDVYVSDDSPDRYSSFLGGHASFAPNQSGTTPEYSFGTLGNDDSDSDDEQNPRRTRLFVIIEEGVPRPNEKMSDEERMQLNEMTYERVRRWLRDHPDLQQRADAVAIRGNNEATPLHNICKMSNPPPDIIQAMVEAVPEVASWWETYGWIPLHFACANGASGKVLEILIDAFPEGRVKQDSENRTPLHFFLTQRCDDPNAMAENLDLLLGSGAEQLPDANGMIAMHYACAYGVDRSVLSILAQAYPKGLLDRENKGRTPMHLAMVNCHRGLEVLRFLLASCGPEIVNVRDYEGYLPLHLLAFSLRGSRSEDKKRKKSISECLKLYLAAEPHASADFLTALQDLPDWLLEVAVVTPHVRNVLNKKIVQRFPTLNLMLDGYMRLLLIVCFEITSMDHIDYRFANDPLNEPQIALSLLYVGAFYFLIREFLQIVSLMTLGSLSSWFWDRTNWLDVAVIVLVFYYAVCMTNDEIGDDEKFRTGVAFTKGVLWISFISFLRSTLVEFSVFVGGVGYVLKRLAAFLMAVGVIIVMFGQMFFIIYVKTPVCDYDEQDVVYTMMMGEVGDENRYNNSVVAQIVYVMYAFLVIILLSNVLIALVTASYEVIQNDRAAIVFWSNRLDFVAEMDAISYGVQNRLGIIDAPTGLDQDEEDNGGNTSSKSYFADAWRNVMQLFDQHLYSDLDFKPSNVDFWCFVLFRSLAVIFIIPLWILLGIFTAGWLWPPQIREWLFAQRETKISRSDLEKQKLNQLIEIQNSIKSIKADITKELTLDRDEITRMKNQIEVVEGRIVSDLQQVRELMTTLLDAGRSRGSMSFDE